MADSSDSKLPQDSTTNPALLALRQRIDALNAPNEALLPTGLGDALLEVSGNAAGPWVGNAVRWAEAAAREGRLEGLTAREIALRWATSVATDRASHGVGTA